MAVLCVDAIKGYLSFGCSGENQINHALAILECHIIDNNAAHFGTILDLFDKEQMT